MITYTQKIRLISIKMQLNNLKRTNKGKYYKIYHELPLPTSAIYEKLL